MTEALEKKFPKWGSTAENPASETKVIAKFFNPTGAGTWYAAEYDRVTGDCFGFADLGDPSCAELGYFSLAELEGVRVAMGLTIERDIHFEPGSVTLKDLIDGKRP
jgi:hypothetical protein